MSTFPHQRLFKASKLLSNAVNVDYYWYALIHSAHNNREAARACAQIFKNGDASADALLVSHTSSTIDDFYNDLFLLYVSEDPQWLSRLGLLESIGLCDHNAYLTDISSLALRESFDQKKACLQTLQNHAVENFSYDQKLSYDIFSWMLHHAVEGEQFLYHEYKLNQMDGIIFDLSALFTQFHKLETQEDVEHYLARLNKIPEQIEQLIAFLEVQYQKGIVLPQCAVQRVICCIQKSIPQDYKKHIFFKHLAYALEPITCDMHSILQQTQVVLQNSVYPAYTRLEKYFSLVLKNAHTNHGVWALPEGDAYYAYMLRHHTTTTLSAQEIHDLGLQEVAQIGHEMRTILTQEGIQDDVLSVGMLVQQLSQNPDLFYPNTDEGRHACLQDYDQILARSREQLAHLFDLKPRAHVKIMQVPPEEEDGQPAAYYSSPSLDGSRPGIFFANLRNMNEVPHYGMETLAIHEGEPGHHFQIALQQEMQMPILRKIIHYTAYTEGWALYAEKLAYEENFYSSSFSKLGHLQDELLRAARLVVDTGIHYKRWSREQAIEYMKATTGYHHDSAVTEVERYFVLPGQACAYKIGQLKILELRKRAQDRLQQKFSLPEFHNVILKVGSVPLDILEEVVEHYILQKLAAL